MLSLKPAFGHAKAVNYGLEPLIALLWALAIDDDRQRREKERRRKRQGQTQTQPKPRPPAGPRPF